MNFIIEEGILKRCIGTEESIVIPDGVIQIGSEYAIGDELFGECPNMKSITFPHGLVRISDYAFSEIDNELEIHIHSMEDWYEIKTWPPGFIDPRRNGKIYIGNKLFQEVVIPEGTTTVNEYAFLYCKDLANVKLPGSLTKIASCAFNGCISLNKIEIPDSVTTIESGSFGECTNLQSIKLPNGLTEIQPYTFFFCKNLKEINLPDGLTIIGNHAFSNCFSLKSVSIPESVREIGDNAFAACSEIRKVSFSPDTIKMSNSAFSDCCNIEELDIPGGIKTTKKISPILVKLNPRFNDEEMAYIGLYQGDKKWVEWFYQKMALVGKERINEVTLKMAEALEKNGKIPKPVQNRLADFMKKYEKEILSANAQKIQACFGDAGAVVEKAPEKEPKQLSIAEIIQKSTTRRDSWLSNRDIRPDSISEVKAVQDADISPVEAALFFIYEYGRQMSKKPSYHAKTYKKDFVKLNISREADAAAAMLNSKTVLSAINQLKPSFMVSIEMGSWKEVPLTGEAFNLNKSKFEDKYFTDIGWETPKLINFEMLLPYARLAGSKEISDLIITAENLMKNWDAVGKAAAIVIRSALLLNDTKEAINYLDKYGMLDYYAEMRGTSVNDIRSSVTSNTGFKSDGSMTFDLRDDTIGIEARITDDLKLILFDCDKDNEIKSFPKKGVDPIKREAAEVKFKEMKTNFKTIVSGRKNLLKKQFLSGESDAADQWTKDYMENPVLMRIAQLLVWDQKGALFTIKSGKAICCDGSSYTITKDEIKLAHPIDMKDNQISEWQKYFLNNNLKQLFAQIWEPVAFRKVEDIKPDRYEGSKITVGHILSLENRGFVTYSYTDDCSTDFDFVGSMTISGSLERAGHYFTERGSDNPIILGKITFLDVTEPRKLNQILAYLDKRIVEEKIAVDNDTFVRNVLSGQTLAQISEYLKLSIEKNAEKCTALLLNYRNENYPEYSNAEEFSLE